MSIFRHTLVAAIAPEDCEIGNVIAAVLDPDTGGNHTFSAPNMQDAEGNPYIVMSSPLMPVGRLTVQAILDGTIPPQFRAALDSWAQEGMVYDKGGAVSTAAAPTDDEIFGFVARSLIALDVELSVFCEERGVGP